MSVLSHPWTGNEFSIPSCLFCHLAPLWQSKSFLLFSDVTVGCNEVFIFAHFCLSSSCQPSSLATITVCSNSPNSPILHRCRRTDHYYQESLLKHLQWIALGWYFLLSFFWKLYILIKIVLLLCDIHLIKMYYNGWSILLKWFSFSSNKFARWQKLWFLCCCKELRAKYRGWGQPWTSTSTPGMTAFSTKLSSSRLFAKHSSPRQIAYVGVLCKKITEVLFSWMDKPFEIWLVRINYNTHQS